MYVVPNRMNLAVVESPSKCKKIASYLGTGWRVIATFGHLRSLEESLEAIGLENNFELKYSFIKEKKKAISQIIEAASNATTIYLCADDDREGEAIAYSVACLLKRDPMSFPRAVFREITEKAVKHAIANPRKIDMNRVFAQQARSVLDMMVGFTISPLLWKYVGRGLSAGRCQTPALRLISDREKEIQTHVSNSSWALKANISPLGTVTMEDELEDQESVLNYLENVHTDDTATVSSITDTPWSASAPLPLITSTLQQEASALHSLPPKETMRIAQSLYEAGHITYMRTDSHVISEEAIKEGQIWIVEKHGKEFVDMVEKVKQKAKVNVTAQEAHEAIRPTHMKLEELPKEEDWNLKDRKIYSLIWRRAVQSLMTSAKGITHKTHLKINSDENEFKWVSSLRKCKFQGWQILGKPAELDEVEDEEQGIQANVKIGDILKWSQIQAYPKRTKASPRYTESTLIRELEKKGIGRPSTFASLIEILFDKEYVEKKDIPGVQITNLKYTLFPKEWPASHSQESCVIGKESQKMVPTALGESVIQFCIREFPQLFAYDFTSSMEKGLDNVSDGSCEWKKVCNDTWGSYKDTYLRLKDVNSLPTQSEKVKEFSNGLKAVLSKKGPLLVQERSECEPIFYSFPENQEFGNITEEIARAWITKLKDNTKFGEWKGIPVYKKTGPYGLYIEYSGRRIPYVEGETLAAVITKLEAKVNPLKRIGQFVFSVGQYGPYMYKDGLKQKVFVSIPAAINVSTLDLNSATALYKKLLEDKKARGNTFKGGSNFKGKGKKRNETDV